MAEPEPEHNREFKVECRKPSLDDRFRELRLAMDVEISRARRDAIGSLTEALTRMRSAANGVEWRDAVLEFGRRFSNDPDALELIASLASLTAPALASAKNTSPARGASAGKIEPEEIDAPDSPGYINGALRINGGLDRHSAAAQRFARVRIAEIQLYYASAVKAGRAGRNIYGTLRPHIEAAREAFRDRFLRNGSKSADYLHAEIVHALANDDATLLGPDYPGPLR